MLSSLLKVFPLGEGMHPREQIVEITTREGPVQMPVFMEGIVDGQYVSVGFPVGRDEDYFLVELPNETVQGYWRVWVASSELKQLSHRA